MTPGEQVVVVGVGNVIHSDDGAGIHALRKLEHDARLPDGVLLVDGGTRGIDLLACLHHASHLLLLDAVDAGEPAGSLVRLEKGDLFKLRGAASVHQLGIADLLTALSLVSSRFPETVLLGLQSASTDWGTELTPTVDAALDELIDAAIQQLMYWSGGESSDSKVQSCPCSTK